MSASGKTNTTLLSLVAKWAAIKDVKRVSKNNL